MGRGRPIVVREDDRLVLSFPIIGMSGLHIGDVRMDWPRRSNASIQRSLSQTRNTLIWMLVVAAIVLTVLIDRLIVRRLRRLKTELVAIVSDSDWNGELSATGSDEIAELATVTSGLMGVLRAQLVELRNLSSSDTLTGLPNRRTFDARLAHVLAQHVRAKRPASLILIDIDHFKRYNDTYGHPAGDAALQQVGKCLSTVLRRQLDLPARLGGEEFAVVCDETPLNGALTCAEMIRKAILDLAITHSGNLPLGIMSISLGVATIHPGDTTTSLYQRADRALYTAKAAGRNCVNGDE
jgi:diguanylate cyclase (GGDEF)-like protein